MATITFNGVGLDVNSLNGIEKKYYTFTEYPVTLTSLPATFTNISWMTENHDVVAYEIETPSAIEGNLTVVTSSQQISISGTFVGGSTTVRLYFAILA